MSDIPEHARATLRLPQTGVAYLAAGSSRGRGDGHFTFGEVIGRGGMGQVVSVLDRDLGREVVMKTLHPGLSADARTLARFVAEAQVTGQLSHPNIVPVHEFGMTAAGEPFFTMKKVEGKDLSRIVAALKEGASAAHERYTLVHRLELFLAICNALAFAHAKGVVHRDLKPANVMVGGFGEVLVMDWGLAKLVGDTAGDDVTAARVTLDRDDSGLVAQTMDGSVVGTPAYMPPEQANGEIGNIDARSDIYSLGAILYELLCFRPPFDGATAWDVIVRVSEGRLVPPGSEAGDPPVPRELVAVVMRAMATERQSRYQSVDALADDIRAFLGGRVLSAAQYSRGQRIRKWMGRNKGLCAGVAFACATLVLGVAASRRHQERVRISTLAEERRRDWEALGVLAGQADGAQPASEAWYQAQTARLVAARELARRDVDARPQLVLAARELARAFARGGNDQAARVILAEVEPDLGLLSDGSSEAAQELEHWFLEYQRAQGARQTAHAVKRVVIRMRGARASDAERQLALDEVLTHRDRPACVGLLIQALFEENTEQSLWLCIEALGRLGDTETAVEVSTLHFSDQFWADRSFRYPDPFLIPRLEGWANAAGLIAGIGSDGAPRRRLDAPMALALVFLRCSHNVMDGRPRATRERMRVAATALGRLGDPRGLALLALRGWADLPGSLPWYFAAPRIQATRASPFVIPDLPGCEPALVEGLVHHMSGRLEAAEEAFARLVAQQPGEAMAWVYYGRLLIDRGQLEDGVRVLERARSLAEPALANPPAVAHLPHPAGQALGMVEHLQGRVLVREGRLDEAAAAFERAIGLGNSGARVDRAWLRVARAESRAEPAIGEEAARMMPAVELARGDCHLLAKADIYWIDAYLALGQLAMREQQWADAIHHCSDALELVPDQRDALMMRARALQAIGRDREALLDGARAVDVYPDDAQAITVLAELQLGVGAAAQWRAGELQLAFGNLQRAIRLDPSAGGAHRLLAEVHVASGALDEAAASVERALERRSDPARCFYWRAHIHRLSGRHDAALADVEAGLAIETDQPVPTLAQAQLRAMLYVERALVWYGRSRADEMLKALAEAGRIDGRDATIDFWRAIAYGSSGRIDDALSHLEIALRKASRSWRLEMAARSLLFTWYVSRGIQQARAGQRDGAIADLSRAMTHGDARHAMRPWVRQVLEQLRTR